MEMEITPIIVCKDKEFNKYVSYVVETIMSQIGANSFTVMSWGAEDFTEVVTKNSDGCKMPCLRFHVNGMKFQGYVHIMLNFLDYYDIEFVSEDNKLIHRMGDVHAFTLQSAIDEYVEKMPYYVR